MLGIGVAIGIFLVAAFVIIRMFMDNTMKSDDDVEKYLRLPVLSDSYKVQKIIQNYPGQTPIVLVDSKRVAKAAPRDWNVKVDEELMSTLQAVFGKENVILR